MMKNLSPYMLSVRRGPDGVMWRETDYHKQKDERLWQWAEPVEDN